MYLTGYESLVESFVVICDFLRLGVLNFRCKRNYLINNQIFKR